LNGVKENREDNQNGIEVFILLGSNINPEKNIPLAIKMLKDKMRIATISSIWETNANNLDDPNFLNCIIDARTNLSLDRIKSEIVKPIEDKLLRVRTENKNAPRTIDIDIVLYDGQEIEPSLWNQIYIAVPLAELIPNYIHKRTSEKLSDVADKLKRENFIVLRNDVKK
jgi:2-amino-4-hydroxy-6-hydroxymethyldihydropteridine diphosphokinase